MSGPKTIEYTIADAILDSYAAYQHERAMRQAEQARREEAAERARQEAIRRREEERKAREAAQRRAGEARAKLVEARVFEQKLERARVLARQAKARGAPDIDLPSLSPPVDPADPAVVESYIGALRDAIERIEARLASIAAAGAADEGLRALMSSMQSALDAEPRTAADLLANYASQHRALACEAATDTEARRTAAERVLGRLAGLQSAQVPADLEALMREIVEAPSEARAQSLLMELRARVQRFNEERARAEAEATENRKREIVGEIVADTLADLGYEVEPIAETLFVSGGTAHFQRADWGDYYVRMRVDPEKGNINVNMVRLAEGGEPDAGQKRRDEEMESAWCAGLPNLMNELSARGIDVKKIRAVDPGALPVQAVRPEAVSEQMRNRKRETRAAEKPREMARPIK